MKKIIQWEIGDQVQWASRRFGLIRGRITHLTEKEARISVTDEKGEEIGAYIVRHLELEPDSAARLRRILS